MLEFANRHQIGVAVTINETSGGRKGVDVTRIRAVWQEDDNGYSRGFPLEPSIVVQSSVGKFHRYWLVDGDWPADDLARAEFTAVMDRMVRDYGSDQGAKDISRAMRLPGTLHQKGAPQVVSIISPNDGGEPVRYTRQEVVSAFVKHPVVISDAPALKAHCNTEVDLDRVVSALSVIPADDRDTWLKVGMALHYGSAGDNEGFTAWDDWSRTTTAGNYDRAEQSRAWKSFRDHATPVTFATVFQLARDHGWEESEISADAPIIGERPYLRFAKTNGEVGVAERAMAAVRERFANYGHQPSEDQFDGLHQIALCIDAMADSGTGTMIDHGEHSRLASNHLVSFLPPGTGKTSVVIETVRELCSEPKYNEIGVIIFLSRLEEIQKLATAMNLGDDFAVIVSEGKPENKLGRQDEKTKARVLFTTQEGLRTRGQDGSMFSDMDRLYYNGRPRQVRIWDEAILPSKTLTVSRNDISEMLKPFRDWDKSALADELEDLFISLKGMKEKSIVTMPDLTKHNVTVDEARNWFSEERRDSVEALIKLSGQRVRVRHGRNAGEVLLNYEEILPPDLAPMLILDASGEFRQTYWFWHESRTGLEFLYSPGKQYNGLTIHHWDRAAGRQAYRDDYLTIAKGVARTINKAIPPGEAVLVVHFLPGRFIPDMEKAISEAVIGDREIHYLTWGKHTATNDFHTIKHVVLAGILQYSVPDNEATGRGAKGIKADDELSDADFNGTRFGEIAHNIFQAACRGYVRHSIGEGCPPDCHLYIIFSTHKTTGVPRSWLSRIFPGSSVIDWTPVNRLSPQQMELAGIIADEAHDKWPKKSVIAKADLSGQLGIRRQRMTELINDELINYLRSEEGVAIEMETRKIISYVGYGVGAIGS